ncbi:MAG: hypothetical protein AAF317_12180 [Pseudomonadota bacterium]
MLGTGAPERERVDVEDPPIGVRLPFEPGAGVPGHTGIGASAIAGEDLAAGRLRPSMILRRGCTGLIGVSSPASWATLP